MPRCLPAPRGRPGSAVTAKATVMATMPAAPKSGVPSVNGLRVGRELCLWAIGRLGQRSGRRAVVAVATKAAGH